jgi:hypothetical protein
LYKFPIFVQFQAYIFYLYSNIIYSNSGLHLKAHFHYYVRRLRRVDESMMSSRISPPGLGELSRRFGDTVVSIFKEVESGYQHIDGDALEDGDHSVSETSGQLTHTRRRYPRRHHWFTFIIIQCLHYLFLETKIYKYSINLINKHSPTRLPRLRTADV